MKEISDLVLSMWKEERLPIINGLLLSDGRIFKNVMSNAKRQSEVFQLAQSDKDYSSWYSSIYATQTVEFESRHIFSGEGSHGSDGFILSLTAANEFHWLLMDYINPIERLTVENGIIHAFNNLNQEFVIPVLHPENYLIKA